MERDVVSQGRATIIGDLHALTRPTSGRRRTTGDDRGLRRILTTADTIAELLGNRDLIEERPRSHHSNAWNRHRVESGKTKFLTLSVVMLEGSNRFGNDLGLGIGAAAEFGLIFLNYQKDHKVEVNKAYVRSCRPVAVSADGKRNLIARAKNRPELIETCDFEDTSSQIVNGSFLSGIGTRCEIEVRESDTCPWRNERKWWDRRWRVSWNLGGR